MKRRSKNEWVDEIKKMIYDSWRISWSWVYFGGQNTDKALVFVANDV